MFIVKGPHYKLMTFAMGEPRSFTPRARIDQDANYVGSIEIFRSCEYSFKPMLSYDMW